jgi:hypothetical protein
LELNQTMSFPLSINDTGPGTVLIQLHTEKNLSF